MGRRSGIPHLCSIVSLSSVMSRWSKSLRHDPIFNSQLKYKRRVYKMLHLDEKQLKAMHTRTNLRRLLEYVANSQVEKIAKMCSKGLDPNFHCQETGGKKKKFFTFSYLSQKKKKKNLSHLHKIFSRIQPFPYLLRIVRFWLEYNKDIINRSQRLPSPWPPRWRNPRRW